jgi:hypothetical protein
VIAPARAFVALVHHPVYDRTGRIVTSAVSNLDIHDIARVSRTYGVGGYYICTPVQAQRDHVGNVVGHWESADEMATSRRVEALALIRTVGMLEDAVDDVRRACGGRPFVVATGAARRPGSLAAVEVRRRAAEAAALLVCFGTGWGLAEEVFGAADAVLDPIDAGSGYNHLPVRAAVAIVLERLLAG